MTFQRISREWPLERYSRLVGDGNDESKTYESGDNFFLRILNSNHLVINHGNDLLENFPLVNAGMTMKGVYIGDSLLVILKLLSGTRRFRVRFKATGRLSASEVCDACTRELQLYMYVTTLDNSQKAAVSGPGMPDMAAVGAVYAETSEIADGKKTVPELAKVIMGIDRSKLSKAYYQAIVPQEELESILRLCLLDNSFPSYVESVEAMIKKLVEESKATT